MELIHDLALNLSGDNSSVRVMAKQHDKNSRSLRCSFCHAGEAYSLPADTAARVILKKPDGKLVMMDAPVTESVVAFPLTPQMLAAAGTASCEIQLYQGDTLLSTAAFPLTILPVTYEDGEPESSDEYQSFTDALMLLDEWTAEEAARAAAEAARVTAEQDRVSAEAARVQAESARAAAEKQRAAAELERASGFQTMQGQSQTQAGYAKAQGDYAKEQGDYAKAEYERLQAVDLSVLQNTVNQIASGFGQLEDDMDALEPRVGALELFQATKAQANGLASLDEAGKLAQMPSAADVGAVPAAEKGTAGGVATLDSSGKLVQIPSAAEVGAIPAAEKGAANGVAALDSAGKLSASALPDGVQMTDDSGWKFPALSSAFKLYSSDPENAVRYRRKNGVVTVSGVVSPSSDTNEIGSSSRVDMFTLPEGFRPATNVVVICQGTSRDVWTLVVNAGSGTVGASRYRSGNAYATPNSTTWMPFTATFLV